MGLIINQKPGLFYSVSGSAISLCLFRCEELKVHVFGARGWTAPRSFTLLRLIYGCVCVFVSEREIMTVCEGRVGLSAWGYELRHKGCVYVCVCLGGGYTWQWGVVTEPWRGGGGGEAALGL